MKNQIIIYLTMLCGLVSCNEIGKSSEESLTPTAVKKPKSTNDIRKVPSTMTKLDSTHYKIEWKRDTSQKMNYFVKVKTDKTTKIYPQGSEKTSFIINTTEGRPIGEVFVCPACISVDPTAMEVDIDIIAFGSGFDITPLKAEYDVLNSTPIQTSNDLKSFFADSLVACQNSENINVSYYLNIHKNPDLMYFNNAVDFDMSNILTPRTTSTPLDKLYRYADLTKNAKVNHDLTVQGIITYFFSTNVNMVSDIYIIRRKKCN